ncbi:MAG: hypothetical protein MR546_00365 [Oscillospiraceae bacterium]|nr:hypothetical protein [Oscillospiraceae bacterium]
MLDKKTVLRLIGSLLIFIIFIASPFILFVRAMLFLFDDSAFGMFIRLFNMAALPIEILSVGIINLIGFLILKKESKLKQVSLIYLLLQTITSVIMTVYFYLKDSGIAGESVVINDIVKPESYIFHSFVWLSLSCIASFGVVLIFYCVDNLKRTYSKNIE